MAARSIRLGYAFFELSMRRRHFERQLMNIQRSFAKTTSKLRTLAGNMFNFLLGGAGIATPFALAFTEFARFEDMMARVQAKSQATGESFMELNATARNLGKTTIFSATQAAQAMEVFAKAGFDAEQIIAATVPTLDAAAAGSLGMGEAASTTINILKGMNLTAEKTADVVNVLTLASISANTDIREMGDAFRYAGPLAALAGASLEDVAGTIQILANSGIVGEMAGTTVRGIISQLTNLPGPAKKAVKEMGIQINDASGKFLGLVPIIDQLKAKLDNLGSGKKLEALSRIFRQRQAAGAAALINADSGTLQNAINALHDSDGIAELVANVQIDTLAGDFKILTSAISELQIAFGEAAGGALRTFIKELTKVVNSVSKFIENNQELVTMVLLAVTAFLGLGGALIAGALVVTALTASIGVLAGAFSGVIGLVLRALGGFGLFQRALTGVWMTVRLAGAFIMDMVSALAFVGNAVRNVLGSLMSFLRINQLLTMALQATVSGIRAIPSLIGGLFRTVGSGFGMLLRSVMSFGRSFVAVWTAPITSIGDLMLALSSASVLVNRILAPTAFLFAGESLGFGVFDQLKSELSSLGAKILEPFRWAGRQIQIIFDMVADWLSGVGKFIIDVFVQVGMNIKDAFMGAFEFLRMILNSVFGWFEDVAAAMSGLWTNVMMNTTTAFDGIWTTFTTTMQGIYDWINNGDLEKAWDLLWDGMFVTGLDVLEGIAKAFGTTMEEMTKFANKFWNDLIKNGFSAITQLKMAWTDIRETLGLIDSTQAETERNLAQFTASAFTAIVDFQGKKDQDRITSFFKILREQQEQARKRVSNSAGEASFDREQTDLERQLDEFRLKRLQSLRAAGLPDPIDSLNAAQEARGSLSTGGTLLGAAVGQLGGSFVSDGTYLRQIQTGIQRMIMQNTAAMKMLDSRLENIIGNENMLNAVVDDIKIDLNNLLTDINVTV